MTTIGNKRDSSHLDHDQLQAANRKWWTDHTMSYDWNERIDAERLTDEWFRAIDERFVFGARLFAHTETPFGSIIPFDRLKGKSVLEIGCGMGLHSELLARNGARLTSIDISDTSVAVTRHRFLTRGLTAEIGQMDATRLEFQDESFDFVWSWGAIHHSADTAIILKEIHRVLRPGGEVRIMVYNLNGMSAYMILAARYMFDFWRGRTLDESLWKTTDGFMSRYYTKDILCDFMRAFFKQVQGETYGQDVDAIPLPRLLRRPLTRMVSHEWLARTANRRGGFLFVTARK